MRAGSVHVVIRHASVEVQMHCVNVVIGVLVVHVACCPACCTRFSSFTCDAVVHLTVSS